MYKKHFSTLFVRNTVLLASFAATMVSASDLLTVVMGLYIALMAVMRLDAVSYNSYVFDTLLLIKIVRYIFLCQSLQFVTCKNFKYSK